MWRLIVTLLFLIASVWIGILIVKHPGYLLLVYQPWMVQMPLWFALLATLIIFGLFYLIIDSIDRLYLLKIKFQNWLHLRRTEKSYSKTQQGLAALIEGQWRRAEQSLIAGIAQTIDPLMNYLGAAKAAHELKAYQRRDDYLKKAYEVAPRAEVAIGLTQADLAIDQHHYEDALGVLNHLRQKVPLHQQVLKRLETIYVRLGDWRGLQALLPSLRKAKMLTPEELNTFEKNLYKVLLTQSDSENVEQLRTAWQQIPKSAKKNPEVVTVYVRKLLKLTQHKHLTESESIEIETLIRKTLKNNWDPDLVSIYGDLPFTNLDKQLVIMGAWLKIYGPRPELLLALGKICVRIKLWGKAKDYFERALAFGPNPEASFEYGKLLEQLGDRDEALQKYRDGVVQSAVT